MITYSATLSCDRPDCKRTQLVSSDPQESHYSALVQSLDRAVREGWSKTKVGFVCPECQAKEKKQ